MPNTKLVRHSPNGNAQVPEIGGTTQVELRRSEFVGGRRVEIGAAEYATENLVFARPPEGEAYGFIDPGPDCGHRAGGRSQGPDR